MESSLRPHICDISGALETSSQVIEGMMVCVSAYVSIVIQSYHIKLLDARLLSWPQKKRNCRQSFLYMC